MTKAPLTWYSWSDDMSPVPGRCGINISPECLLSEISEDDLYDLVFVPGGLAAAEAFAASPTVGAIYTRHNSQNKLVAAICASPIAFKYVNCEYASFNNV